MVPGYAVLVSSHTEESDWLARLLLSEAFDADFLS